jgi:hypothetical protein
MAEELPPTHKPLGRIRHQLPRHGPTRVCVDPLDACTRLFLEPATRETRKTRSLDRRLLTAAEFQRLAKVPPESEWFKNIRNPATKRAYEKAPEDFMRFTGSSGRRNFAT